MKRKTMMMLALATMTAGVAVNAENTNAAGQPAKAQAVAPAAAPVAAQKAPEAAGTKLSADEQAFVAKLNDQNRKAFNEKLSVEQKKSAMVAVKNGANADEAVQKLAAAKDVKDAPAVANAEKAPAAAAAPAAQAK